MVSLKGGGSVQLNINEVNNETHKFFKTSSISLQQKNNNNKAKIKLNFL